MVLSFFKSGSGEGDLDHIVAKTITMLGNARHSFDLATLVLLTDAETSAVEDDIRDTDDQINQAEQELRSELVVHVSVKGTADIGSVLGLTLVLKKIERIGDQAKNILELAISGISLSDRPNIDSMLAERQELSSLFTEAADLLGDPDADEEAIAQFVNRANDTLPPIQEVIDGCMVSEQPGSEVVPLAFYYRYLRRIVVNLIGAVRSATEPVPLMDHHEDLDD